MGYSYQEIKETLQLPEHTREYTRKQFKELWVMLGNIACNWDEDGSNLVAIEGVEDSDTTVCLDEDFFLWKRGASQEDVWIWFDEESPDGIVSLMYGKDENNE